jgi:hypothetical protein
MILGRAGRFAIPPTVFPASIVGERRPGPRRWTRRHDRRWRSDTEGRIPSGRFRRKKARGYAQLSGDPSAHSLKRAVHWPGSAALYTARGSERDSTAMPPRRAFVGRNRELDEVAGASEDTLAGRGGLFLLVGGAGIGKTRLCDELTRLAEERGLQPLWGRCWETGGAPAYWPWIQILARWRATASRRAQVGGRLRRRRHRAAGARARSTRGRRGSRARPIAGAVSPVRRRDRLVAERGARGTPDPIRSRTSPCWGWASCRRSPCRPRQGPEVPGDGGPGVDGAPYYQTNRACSSCPHGHLMEQKEKGGAGSPV